MRKCVTLFVLLVLTLTGCGGGGGSTGSASVAASTDSAGPTPLVTPTVQPTPVGNGVFAGKLTNELGHGLAGATLTAAASGAKSASASASLAATTGEDGSFTLHSLQVGTTYTLIITSEGRKTLKTSIVLTEVQPELNIVLVAPKGSGEVEFTMPEPLHLSRPVTTQDKTALAWTNSVNPGFLAYVLYHSEQAGAGTAGTQIAAKLAPNDVTFVDVLDRPGHVYYYRVYEKLLIPELQAFMLVGSNEVQSVFPVVDASPLGNDVSISSVIELTFSVEMNNSSVEQAFTLVAAGEAPVRGTFAWEGQKVRFTPAALRSGRSYTVTLNGATSAFGDTLLPTPFTFQFQTRSGYVRDTSLDATELGQLRRTWAGNAPPLAIDGADDLGADGQKYSQAGSYLGAYTGPAPPGLTALDPLRGRYEAYTANLKVDRYDAADNFVDSFLRPGGGASAASTVFDAAHRYCVLTGNGSYSLTDQQTRIEFYDGSTLVGSVLLSPHMASVFGVGADRSGAVYAGWFTYQGAIPEIVVCDGPTNLVTRFSVDNPDVSPVPGGRSLVVDSVGRLYFWSFTARGGSTQLKIVRYIPAPK